MVLTMTPCSVPEFGVFAERNQRLMDLSVEAYWDPRYRRYRCVAMAQILAESSGDAGAVSSTGAQGLAQVMPGTQRYLAERYGVVCSPFDPGCAFRLHALYSGQLIRYFKARRPEGDRVGGWMPTAYHAGPGNADRAQARCGGARLYRRMEPCLPAVIGEKNAEHNRRYVRRIASLFRRMTGLKLLDLD